MMIIKPKFKAGQSVYFVKNHMVLRGTIIRIKIEIDVFDRNYVTYIIKRVVEFNRESEIQEIDLYRNRAEIKDYK